MRSIPKLGALLSAAFALGSQAAFAQSPGHAQAGQTDEGELAKQLSNPVAALISVPFQANMDYGIGSAHGDKFTLNIQPVVPISLDKDWNLIIRTILPVVSQHNVSGNSGTQSGLGDTTQSFFLSPQAPAFGHLIWGVGPALYYPTATDSMLGAGKFGMGPTAVALVQEHGWTAGILANQIWSVAGPSDRQNINATFLQPFVAYTTKTYTTFTVDTESTYDWERNQWTVPINFMVSQIFKIGGQPMSVQLGGRYTAEGPTGHSDWGFRVNFTLLFPVHHGDAGEKPDK